MATYEINDGTNPINIAELLKKDDDNSGFINLITINKTQLQTKLDLIHDTIKKINQASINDKSPPVIITDNTDPDNIKKIHFLAASVYQQLVTLCLTELGTDWDDVNTIIKDKLPLVQSGSDPTNFDHFYINSVDIKKLTIDNTDNILMYHLLLELIKDDMKPNIDDVLDFLSKIDRSWCVNIDEAIVEKVIVKENGTDYPAKMVNLEQHKPVRSLGRLYAIDPDNDKYELFRDNSKKLELYQYIRTMKQGFEYKNTVLIPLLVDGTPFKQLLDNINGMDASTPVLEIQQILNETVNDISIYQIYQECELLMSKLDYLVIILNDDSNNAFIAGIKGDITTLLQKSNLYLGTVTQIDTSIQKIAARLASIKRKFYSEIPTLLEPLKRKIIDISNHTKLKP